MPVAGRSSHELCTNELLTAVRSRTCMSPSPLTFYIITSKETPMIAFRSLQVRAQCVCARSPTGWSPPDERTYPPTIDWQTATEERPQDSLVLLYCTVASRCPESEAQPFSLHLSARTKTKSRKIAPFSAFACVMSEHYLFEPESWRFHRTLLSFTCPSLEAGPPYSPLTGSPPPYVRGRNHGESLCRTPSCATRRRSLFASLCTRSCLFRGVARS